MQVFELKSNCIKQPSPVFGVFMQGLLLLMLIVSSQFSYAKKANVIEQCEQEIAKEVLDIPLIKKVCLEAAEQAEVDKEYGNASWYYLLAGEIDYIIKEMPKHIDPKKSTYIYGNLGHVYVLKDQPKKAKEMYWKFLTLGGQNMLDGLTSNDYDKLQKKHTSTGIGDIQIGLQKLNTNNPIRDDYQLLNKRYPLNNESLNRGLQYWEKTNEKFIKALQQANNYSIKGMDSYTIGKYAIALNWFQQALTVEEKVLGKKHPDTATSYDNIGSSYGELGNHAKALKYQLNALSIREKVLGKEHPNTATSYNNIGSSYGELGNHAKALKYQLNALSIREKVRGKEHPDTATSYNNVGFTYGELGNHVKALEYLLNAMSIMEKVRGKEHPDTATSYNNVGFTYGELGNHIKALKYLLNALSIKEKVLGKEHPNTAGSYNNVGSSYGDMGNPAKALEYQLNALSIREKVLGKEHPDTAISYNNVGSSYGELGNPAKALEYQLNALSIREKVLGKEHPDTAGSYNNVGSSYGDMGNPAKALEYQLNALSIKEKVLGKEHPNTAISYNNVGSSYGELGNPAKALEYQLNALSIREKVLGKEHPDTAGSYNNVGSSYGELGNPAKALEYQLNALSIREKVLGKEHPDTATSYNNVGSSYGELGNPAKALEYQLNALSIREKVRGKEHPDTAISYNNVGFTYGELGNPAKAYRYAKKAFIVFLNQRGNAFSALNSQQKKLFLKANERYIDFLLLNTNLYTNDLLSNKENQKVHNLQQSTSNDWLAYKGSILDAENRLLLFAKTAKSPELKKQYQVYIEAKQTFSLLNQNTPDSKEKISAWKKQIKTQEGKISALEQTIKKSDPRFKDEKYLQAINTKDIAKGLTQDSLYIDFAKTNAGYYLFTIDHQNAISFTAYSKDDSKAIDEKITAFQTKMQTIAKNTKLIGLAEDKTKQTLGELYKLIFNKDLLDNIADKTSLIISPDGALRLLPFEALFNKDKKGGGQYLIESKDIRYIASGKELVRLFRQNKDKTSNNKAVLFANPDFGGEPSKKAKETRSTVYTSKNTDDGKTLGILGLEPSFSSLAGTKTEADAIASILTVEEILHDYRGKDANEAHLLQVKQPKILHIATHGFFLKDIPNPMLKSGLVLAGANRSLKENKGDGIVTALDLSGLELQGTDLVVLSACETGKVDPNNTDGISGLTKAFIQAGAKDVVMSLWSVDDDKTASLMTAFYSESKKNNSQYAKALKKSKLDLLDKGLHPYYWAAFVLSGL